MRIVPPLLAIALSCSACNNTAPEPVNIVEAAPIAAPAPSPPPPRSIRDARTLPGPVTAIELTDAFRRATIYADGSGYFELAGGTEEPLTITPAAFRKLEARLVPYRQEATPYEGNAPEIVVTGCGRGLPYTEAGHVSIRWSGKGFGDEYINLLGCDGERKRASNAELLNILATVPKPKSPLPPQR